MYIATNKKVKFDGARCLISTFLRLQGDHHCACAQKWCHFSFFPRAFKQQKNKMLRPKMTKIALRGSCLKAGPPCFEFLVIFDFLHHSIEKIERHFLWKFYKKNSKGKLVKCATEVARFHRVSIQSCTQNRPSPKVQSLSRN